LTSLDAIAATAAAGRCVPDCRPALSLDGRLSPLPEDWGRLEVVRTAAGPPDPSHARAADRSGPPAARSHNHRGETLLWRPGPACLDASRTACDWEHSGRFHNETCRLFSLSPVEGLIRWVLTETLAKLAGVPMLSFWRAYGFVSVPRGRQACWDLGAWGGRGVAECALLHGHAGTEAAAVGWVAGT
jgi:hypothetical protein